MPTEEQPFLFTFAFTFPPYDSISLVLPGTRGSRNLMPWMANYNPSRDDSLPLHTVLRTTTTEYTVPVRTP